jgi:uncharacterized membrane protein HdeD (DUF308 family)
MTETSATSVQAKQRPWWMTLIMVILAFVVGAILLWAPAKPKVETYQLFIAFLSVYWLSRSLLGRLEYDLAKERISK